MELPELLELLSQPAAYPYPVEEVEVRQTHISAVFLAGPYVYKVKKPVNLGFLDFSTLEKRRHFCEQEVTLNRRLAPSVYRGVVPVVRSSRGIHFEGEGEVVEWAVKMERLPEEATLLERLRRGAVGVPVVEALARRIAAFHQAAAANERIASFGRREGVARIVLDVFDQAAGQVDVTVSRAVFDRVRAAQEANLERLGPLIADRAARGMPRDTHGDLHLDHIYVFPDRQPPDDLIIIDCIEFNERFRYTDPVADMAFPLMDLLFEGRRDLAAAFADAYFRAAGDEAGRALLPMYTAYRATVRGAVEGLLLAEQEVPEATKNAALRKARAHWLLALGEVEAPGQKPCLLLVGGLPGTGKSSLARELATRAGFFLIRSDVVRKELAGLAPDAPAPLAVREQLYSPESLQDTYAECVRRAEQLLFQGKRVLVDATFRAEARRLDFLDTARSWAVPALVLVCQAAPVTVRQRLEARRGDASDADWSIYLQAAGRWEEAGPATRRALHVIPTDGTLEEALVPALAAVKAEGV
jgi:aminoglycoside phosphotransferase family enzyme/predicted kinase